MLRTGMSRNVSRAVLLISAAAFASAAQSAVTYTFTGIDGGIVEAAVYSTPHFAGIPTDVPASQLDWCSIAGSRAGGSPTCSSLSFASDSAGGTPEDVLVLTRDDDARLTPSYFIFSAGTFGKIGMFRTIGSNMGILSVTGSAAPEPSTWLMLIAGFGSIGLSCRRRRASLNPASVSPRHMLHTR